MGEITAADIILALLAQKPTGHESGKGEATAGKRKYESQKEILDKIDLTGLGERSQNEQKEVQELLTEYASIFATSDMDLGKTSLVKHIIILMDYTPLKEHYWWIPLSMYEEVGEHQKEMLEIGAIWPSYNPWASPVVLVCKKDGKLCIDLQKLNAHTIKDSYSLPRIEETLGQFEWGCLDYSTIPQVWLLATQDGWGLQTIDGIHYRSAGILKMWSYAFQTGECSSYIPEADGGMYGGPSA